MKTLYTNVVTSLTIIAVLFFFIPIPPARAAGGIAFDKSGVASSGGTHTVTVTLAAAATSEVALIWIDYDPADTFSTLTVGGSSTGVTQVGTEFQMGGGANRKGRLYRLVNPPTGSSAYSFTTTGSDANPFMNVALYSGVDQTNPIDSSNTGSATQNVTLSTTVVAANAWLVGFVWWFGVGGITATAGTGTTIRSSLVNVSAGGDSNATVGTGSQSLVFNTSSGSITIGGYIVSLKPTTVAFNPSLFWDF